MLVIRAACLDDWLPRLDTHGAKVPSGLAAFLQRFGKSDKPSFAEHQESSPRTLKQMYRNRQTTLLQSLVMLNGLPGLSIFC